MKGQFKDIFFVVALIAIIVLFQESERDTVEPDSSPSPGVLTSQVKTLSVGDLVPNFSLRNSKGETVVHEQGQGPLLITLTARGCKGCMDRIDSEDVTAFEMAKKSGVDVWNLLVYHPDGGAADFVKTFHPSADEVLADPMSDISVKMLGGSDSTCWLLLDGQGKLVYRGPVELELLQEALANLGS